MPATDLQYKQQLTLIHALLQRPDWSIQGVTPELIETHISWVILCGEFAYKIKKSLDLGFLDFSTLEKRKYYCEEELRLNSRLAPDLYLEVTPIYGSFENPDLDRGQQIIEYAVKMRRFPQESLFSKLLEQGKLTPALIEGIAQRVAQFHQDIPAAENGTTYGSPENIWQPVEENISQITPCVSAPEHQQMLKAISQWSSGEFEQLREVFIRRKQNGYVRECHGDMHLGNIILYQGKPCLFDGIEFNANLRWIDVISEIAFCCMDLDDHRQPQYSFLLLNHYLATTGDYEGIQVLRYYLTYRAMVRAKVACIGLQQQDHSQSSQQERAFKEYFSLALHYTQPAQPLCIITYGFSGSGKSTITWPLAQQIQAIHLRSDRERQRLFSPSPGSEPNEVAQGIYTAEATEATYDRLARLSELTLAAGFSVIVDATFLQQAQREKFHQLSSRTGIPLCILHFKANEAELRQRIVERAAQQQDISEANTQVLDHQLAHHDPLTMAEIKYTVEIDTEKKHAYNDLEQKISMCSSKA